MTCSTVVDGFVGGVLTTRPNNNSLGENLRVGSSCEFMILTASSRWSGQFIGVLLVFRVLPSSSHRFWVHSCLSMCNRILLVPSTRPLIHGGYAGTM